MLFPNVCYRHCVYAIVQFRDVCGRGVVSYIENLTSIPNGQNQCRGPWELASKSLKDDCLPTRITEEFPLKLNVSLEDWSVAYRENRLLYETIQSLLIRVPKIIFGAPWNFKADIWSLEATIVRLLGNFEMFEVDDDHGNYNE